MRHYEIVMMVRPDNAEKIVDLIEQYTDFVIENNGQVHRIEDWGCKQLAYSIKQCNKAHYILMNIEIQERITNELSELLNFNTCIMRHMIMRTKRAITKPSIMLKQKQEAIKNQQNTKKT